MKKWFKILIFVFVLVAFSSFVSAMTTDNLLSYYNLSDGVDIHSTRDFSATGSPKSLPGLIDNATNFTGNDRYSNTAYIDPDDYNTGLSYSGWFLTDNVSHVRIFEVPESAGNGIFELRIEVDGDMYFETGCAGSACWHDNIAVDNVTDGEWHFFVLAHNTSHDTLTIDNNQTFQFGTAPLWGHTNDMYIGGGNSNILPLNGMLDEFGVWNTGLNATDISVLYNSGSGLAYPFTGGIGATSFVPPTPTDGATNNTLGSAINVTCTIGDVSLWFDNNTNPVTTVLSVIPSPANWTITQDAIVANDTFYYKASCDNGTTNSSIRTWTFDTGLPTLTILYSNSFNTDNETTDKYSYNLTFNMSITDNSDLFGFQVLVKHPNGTYYYNYTNESLSGLTTFAFERSLNVSDWPASKYNMTIAASDSHTKQGIGDYIVKKSNKRLEFDTTEGNTIIIETDENAITDSTKDKDRYIFDFNFESKGTKKRTFYIKSASKIYYLKNSKYNGHFVVGGMFGNWVDFEGAGTASITKISDYEYKIEFSSLGDNIKFESIGGLNKIEQTYEWTHSNLIVNNSRISPAEPIDTDNLISYCMATEGLGGNVNYEWIMYKNNVNLSSGNTTDFASGYELNVYNISSAVTANNDNFTLSCKASTVGKLNYTNWLNSSVANIVDFQLDNCSTYNVTSLIINVWNEETLTNITANITGTFTYNTSGTQRNYTIDVENVHNVSICIYPPSLNVTLNAYMQYGSSGGKKERYYLVDLNVHNVTQNIKLYNLVSTNEISKLNAIVVDDTYTNYVGIYMKMQRYYPGINSWIQVQMDKSDEFGQGVFYVYQEYVDYKFVFEQNGVILDTTIPLKFICGAVGAACEQTFVIVYDPSAAGFSGMTGDLTYNNNTGLFTMTWNDPSNTATSIRLLVEQHTSRNVMTICDNRQTAASGSINCNVSGYDGVILARGYRGSSPDKPWLSYNLDKIAKELQELIGSNTGMFISGLIMLAAVGVGITMGPMATVIFTMVGFIFIFLFKLNSVLSLGMLIGGLSVGVIVAYMVKR